MNDESDIDELVDRMDEMQEYEYDLVQGDKITPLNLVSGRKIKKISRITEIKADDYVELTGIVRGVRGPFKSSISGDVFFISAAPLSDEHNTIDLVLWDTECRVVSRLLEAKGCKIEVQGLVKNHGGRNQILVDSLSIWDNIPKAKKERIY